MIYYIVALLILITAFLLLLKYSKAYDKRFGSCSSKFVIGQLIIVIGILITIVVIQVLLG